MAGAVMTWTTSRVSRLHDQERPPRKTAVQTHADQRRRAVHLAHLSVFLQFDGLGQVVAIDQRALFAQRL
jgi:hypothetical protein